MNSRFSMRFWGSESSAHLGSFWNVLDSWPCLKIYFIWLVVSTPLKNICQLGWLFLIYGKIKNGNQTTNQMENPIKNAISQPKFYTYPSPSKQRRWAPRPNECCHTRPCNRNAPNKLRTDLRTREIRDRNCLFTCFCIYPYMTYKQMIILMIIHDH